MLAIVSRRASLSCQSPLGTKRARMWIRRRLFLVARVNLGSVRSTWASVITLRRPYCFVPLEREDLMPRCLWSYCVFRSWTYGA
jgi:hypothetical protein